MSHKPDINKMYSRHMSTAPLDGTPILIKFRESRYVDGRWVEVGVSICLAKYWKGRWRQHYGNDRYGSTATYDAVCWWPADALIDEDNHGQ